MAAALTAINPTARETRLVRTGAFMKRPRWIPVPALWIVLGRRRRFCVDLDLSCGTVWSSFPHRDAANCGAPERVGRGSRRRLERPALTLMYIEVIVYVWRPASAGPVPMCRIRLQPDRSA